MCASQPITGQSEGVWGPTELPQPRALLGLFIVPTFHSLGLAVAYPSAQQVWALAQVPPVPCPGSPLASLSMALIRTEGPPFSTPLPSNPCLRGSPRLDFNAVPSSSVFT